MVNLQKNGESFLEIIYKIEDCYNTVRVYCVYPFFLRKYYFKSGLCYILILAEAFLKLAAMTSIQ